MILRQHFKYLLFFLVLIMVLYSPSYDCGFFSDDYIGLDRYQEQGLLGFKNNFNDRFFLPVAYLFQVIELFLFGKNYFFYHLTNILLFALSTNILRICIAESGFFNNPVDKQKVSFLAALIFAVIPYQTETVNWYSSQAYLISVLFTLISAYYLIQHTKKRRWSLTIHFIFLFLAISAKEIALTTPLIFIIYLHKLNMHSRSFLIKYTIYCVVVLSLYFIWRVISLGEIIGGYGQDVHLNVDVKLLSFNFASYLSKFFLYHRYFEEWIRIVVSISVVLIGGFYILKGIIRKRPDHKLNPVIRLLPLFFCFVLSVLPVLNLETSFLHSIQSDRYGYFPSIFFAVIVAILFQKIKLNWYRNTLTFCFLSLNTYLCIKDNIYWKDAGNYRDNYIIGLRSINDKNTLVLNVADNYNGIYIFRNGLNRCLAMNNIKCRPTIAVAQEVLPSQSYDVFRSNRNVFFATKPGVIYSVFSKNKLDEFNVQFQENNKAKITLRSENLKKVTYFNGREFIDF